MKQFYLNTTRMLTMAATAIVLLNTNANAQSIPELVFKNGTRLTSSPAAGTNGAIYWFKNVGTGVDAFVKINGRSSNNVVLRDLDIPGSETGYENSFQPLIDYTGGGSYSNSTVTEWYMEFKISFVKSSDTSVSVPVTTFNATALDVDGTGSGSTYLHEAYTFYGLTSYTVANNTSLTRTDVTGGKKFEAGNTEYSGIDVDAQQPRVTTKYDNTSSFLVRIGGKAKGSIDINNNGRQYSLWFKGFEYTTPVETPVILPVDLLSFTARLNNNKATILDWTTSNEKDFSHFVVERSTDAKSFTDAGMIFSDDNNKASVKTYSYTDNAAVQSTIIYYRLRMVDIDGKYKYSEVRLVRKANDPAQQASILVYPNPVITDIRVTIPDSWQGKSVSYTIYNSNGNVVRQKTNNQAGQTEVLSMIGSPAGLYMVKVMQGTEMITKQIVKQN